MKKLLYLLLVFSPYAFAQPSCPTYNSIGTSSSPYITSSDPDCAICPGTGDDGPWTGSGCTGTIVSTPISPTTSLTLAYTAVNTDDYATITIDGGGTMTLIGTNVGVTGDVIGPYLCGGFYGDVFLTVNSTLPFTTVTLTNTGCSSGWVIACPGGIADAGNDSSTVVCTGTVILSDLLSPGAESGGIWTETTGSGFFDPITTEFDAGLAGVGIYTFEYVVVGCEGATDTAVFTVSVGPGGSAGEDNTAEICNMPGETIDLNTLLVGADPGGVWAETSGSGSFNPITGVFTAAGLAGGDYTFTYTFPVDPPCLDDVADFTITVHPAPIITIVSNPSPAVICQGETMILTASGAGIGGTYIWDHPITNGVAFGPSVGTDTYTVTATDVFGCSSSASIDIEVELLPVVIFEADTTRGCDPFEVTFYNNTLLPGVSCLWDFGDGSTSASCGTVTHTYNTVGEFDVSLLVNSSALCGASETEYNYIVVKKQPEANFSYLPNPIDIENTTVEFDNTSLYANIFSWDFNDYTSFSSDFEPTHVFPTTPNATYNVTLTASNDIGCFDVATKKVFVNDVIIFYVPNTFTPDGDDFNEVFKPVMTSGYDVYDYHLVIYNRWGEIIFESFNANIGWNGTYKNGSIVPDGVYVWRIEFGDTISDEKHEYMGHVNVLR